MTGIEAFLTIGGISAVLIIISGFFSSSETALFSLPKIYQNKIQKSIQKKDRFLKRLLSNTNELLVTILFGNMLVNILLSTYLDNTSHEISKSMESSLQSMVSEEVIEVIRVGVTVIFTTLVLIVFGEILPKLLAIRFSTRIATMYSPVLRGFQILIFPIRIVLLGITEWMAKKIVKSRNPSDDAVSEEEFRTAVKIGFQEQILPREELFLLENVMEFSDLQARHIMTPRTQITGLHEEATYSKIMYEIRKSRFSQYPVYNNSLDSITGVVSLKELLTYAYRHPEKPRHIKPMVQKPYFIPETKHLIHVLEDFRTKKVEMIIVVDEYGGTAGIITLTDILETILGRVTEHDEDTRNIFELKKNTYIIAGDTSMEEFRRTISVDVDDGDEETVAGYLLRKMDCIPKENDTFQCNQYVFTIKRMEQNRIASVMLFILEETQDVESDSGNQAL